MSVQGKMIDLHKRMAAAESEVERLTAENEAIRKDRDDLLQQALGVEAERDIARMENERLRERLLGAQRTLWLIVRANDGFTLERAECLDFPGDSAFLETTEDQGAGTITFRAYQQLTPETKE